MSDYYALDPDRTLLLDSLTLEKLAFHCAEALGDLPFVDDSTDFRVQEDATLGRLVYHMRAYVLAEKLVEETTTIRGRSRHVFYVPARPGQHFKMKHSGDWWMRRFVQRHPAVERPIEHFADWHRDVRIQQYATFPASPIRTPETHRGPIIVRQEMYEVSR